MRQEEEVPLVLQLQVLSGPAADQLHVTEEGVQQVAFSLGWAAFGRTCSPCASLQTDIPAVLHLVLRHLQDDLVILHFNKLGTWQLSRGVSARVAWVMVVN